MMMKSMSVAWLIACSPAVLAQVGVHGQADLPVRTSVARKAKPPVYPRYPVPLIIDESNYGGLSIMFNYYDHKNPECVFEDPSCITAPVPNCNAPFECIGTLVSLYYPEGTGPTFLGYPELEEHEKLPLVIGLKGGGTADTNHTFLNWGFFRWNVTNYPFANGPGFLGVEANYPPVDWDNDLSTPARGIAYLIQWLRFHSRVLNLHPDSVVLYGRSFGGAVTYATGLWINNQDLDSPDVIERMPSRPDVMVPFSSPTDLTCFVPGYSAPIAMLMAWPQALGPGGTYEQKLQSSPTYWIQNPQLFGFDRGIPIGMGYVLGGQTPCGSITNHHDGHFGPVMVDAIDQILDPTLKPPSVMLWDSATEIMTAELDQNFELILSWALNFLPQEP